MTRIANQLHQIGDRKVIALKILGVSSLVAAALAVAWQAYYIFAAGNFHVVLPERVFRCGQLSGEALERIVSERRIRTVVNLRGCCPAVPWYLEECRASHHLNVAQEDICFSANRLPAAQELRRLIEVLDRSEYPILLHCRHGADRTGLASAVVLLLQTQCSLREARGQLAVSFGHFSVGRLQYLDRFFDLYADWLRRNELEHSSDHFREWVSQADFPGEGRCRIDVLEIPDHVACGDPGWLRVLIHNTGMNAWQFRSGTNAGYHAGFIVFDNQDRPMAYGRAGLLDTQVLPGQSIDLTVVLPAIKIPGKYRVWVDMVDEPQGWFYQLGSEPLEAVITVTSDDSE